MATPLFGLGFSVPPLDLGLAEPLLNLGMTPPAPSFAGATRWEILVVGPNTSHDVGIDEAEFALTAAGADQATGGSAYDSGQWDTNNRGTNLFGNTTSPGIAQGPGTSIAGYNMGVIQAITKVRLRARTSFQGQMPKVFGVRSSDDGVAFNFHGFITDSSAWSSGETREYDLASLSPLPTTGRSNARIWAINITATAGGGTIRCGSFELATSPGGANIISTPYLPYCTRQNQLPAERALDPSLSNSWAADFVNPTRLGVILPSAEGGIAELRLGCMTNESANDMPGAFSIQWSIDGVTWNTTDTYTGQTWSSGQVRTYTVTAS